AAGEIDQIIGVNRQRPQIIFFAQRRHLAALRSPQVVWLPLARAGRKDLKGIAAQPVGSLRRHLWPSRGRSVDPDAPRSQPWRLQWRWHLENVLFSAKRAWHTVAIKSLSSDWLSLAD